MLHIIAAHSAPAPRWGARVAMWFVGAVFVSFAVAAIHYQERVAPYWRDLAMINSFPAADAT